MSKLFKILWGTLGSLLVVTALTLTLWGIPAPSVEVTKTLPADRFVK